MKKLIYIILILVSCTKTEEIYIDPDPIQGIVITSSTSSNWIRMIVIEDGSRIFDGQNFGRSWSVNIEKTGADSLHFLVWSTGENTTLSTQIFVDGEKKIDQQITEEDPRISMKIKI